MIKCTLNANLINHVGEQLELADCRFLYLFQRDFEPSSLVSTAVMKVVSQLVRTHTSFGGCLLTLLRRRQQTCRYRVSFQ